MPEILDVYDSDMNITGSMERELVHSLGLWHRVVHIWIVSKENNSVFVYFQKRSMQKQQQPGLFDIAVGGHVSSGEDVLKSAVREMYEEMGVTAEENELINLGRIRDSFADNDNEFADIFAYVLNTAPDIGEEVDTYIKIDAERYFNFLNNGEEKVEAVCENESTAVIDRKEWCSHPREYEDIVYPWIKANF